MSSVTSTAGEAPAATGFLAEMRATTVLGVPLALAQLGQIAINTTDVLILGRLGPQQLASASLAMALFSPLFLFALGLVTAVSPLVAQALGGRRPREVRRAVRQGFWVGIAISVPLLLILWLIRPILLLLGQDPVVVEGSRQFMHAFMWGLPFAVGQVVLRCFVTGFGRTRAVLLITFAGVALNALVNYGLVFGHLGLPRLELVGAGIGSTVVNAAMFLALLLYGVRARPFRRHMILARFWRPDPETFGRIWRIGLPIGLGILLEVGMFSTALLMMGLIGTLEVAAHQVTLQLAATAFMVPLGIGQAATIRVGRAFGAHDRAGIRRAGHAAYLIATLFTAAAGIAFWLAPEALVRPFLDPDQADTERVVALAIGFLGCAALFQVVDGLQVLAASALRGMSDTRMPMLLAFIGYWLVGVPTSAVLAFYFDLEGIGIWLGLAFGLATAAALLMLRFQRLTAWR